MFSATSMSFACTGGSRHFGIFVGSACLVAALANASARGAPSDTLQITYTDGTPVIAGNGISVDYKIGTAATVTLQPGQTLGPIDLPEPALESTGEGRLVVNIDGYLTINPTIMVGLGSKSAYLLEPPPPAIPTTFSDIMQCVTRQNPSNALHRDFEFTLISSPDPALASANPLPGDLQLLETGLPQDLSTGLFTATPNHSEQVAPPFHVFVTSDLDLAVPEPGPLALLAVASLTVLKPHRLNARKRRRTAFP